jgi:hypothetical protein
MNFRKLKGSKELMMFFCALSLVCAGTVRSQERIRYQEATVGKTDITARDILYLKKMSEPDSLSTLDALATLIRVSLDREIAASLGLQPTDADRKDLDKHVNATTQAPVELQKLKDVFSDNQTLYTYLFLEPVIVDAKIRAYQSRDTVIQRQARMNIEKLFARAASGGDFNSLAATVDGAYTYLDTISLAPEPVGTSSSGVVVSLRPDNSKFKEAVAALAPGQLYSKIIENDQTFQVVGLQQKNTRSMIVSVIAVPKESFDKWYEQKVRSIPITIYDPVLLSSFKSTFSDVWWVGQIQ